MANRDSRPREVTGLPQNPFQPTKIEHDRDPVFWLSGRAKELAGTMKHAHVSGSRGSGKTTLLRSLRTSDIRTNHMLRTQYNRSTFDWFGVYIQLNRTLQTVTDGASRAILKLADLSGRRELVNDADVYVKVFSFYLELTILQAFLDDIRLAKDRRDIYIPARVEAEVGRTLIRLLTPQAPQEWADLYTVTEELQRTKALFTSIPTETTVSSLIERVNAFSSGDLLDQLVHMIGALKGQMLRKDREIRPLVLIDDCESLLPEQQAILNTILKGYEGRVKFIIAFIAGQYDSNTTFLPNTVLKDDDFLSVKIDEESRAQFKEFCEHVTRTRFNHFYEVGGGSLRSPLPPFELERVLGDPSPNVMIATLVASSVSQLVKNWDGQVKKTREELRAVIERPKWPAWSIMDGQTPYIEHFFLETSNTKPIDLRSVRSRESLTKQIDRKQVAALVYIVEKHFPRTEIPYAGYNTVMNLSAGCIRDYLDIMAAIYDELTDSTDANWSTERNPGLHHLIRFASAKTPIRWETQRAGILKSSQRKWDALRDFKVKSDIQIVEVIAGLSAVLVELQRPASAERALSTPERGIFVFDPETLDTILSLRRSEVRTRDVMRVLQRDGFIRIVTLPEDRKTASKADSLVKFHVHNRLYPVLRISHRGPYRLVRLDENQFASLILDGLDGDPSKWARSVAKRAETNGKKQEEFGL